MPPLFCPEGMRRSKVHAAGGGGEGERLIKDLERKGVLRMKSVLTIISPIDIGL